MSEQNSSNETNKKSTESNHFNSKEMLEIFESLSITKQTPTLSNEETDKVAKAWSQVTRKKLFNIIE